MARSGDATPSAVGADARALPFADGTFDYCIAVTSLCFVEPPARALAEMWRVCREGVFLGLLNRRSVLYAKRRGRGGYRGARWDTRGSVEAWAAALHPRPTVAYAGAVFLPGCRRACWGAGFWPLCCIERPPRPDGRDTGRLSSTRPSRAGSMTTRCPRSAPPRRQRAGPRVREQR
ncbi:MAG: class I SAM-dependent methyltransferase [Gammaproteobacteria bacterium]